MVNYVGKRLDGRYEVNEIIGIGEMSVVYKAFDNVDDKIVAVKILKDEFLSNEEFVRRFKNESKAITLLSHPNIVKVYDVSFGEKLQYIVMEYVDGITLKEYIQKQGAITWNDALFFATQILKALQHAHDKGIVHGDIKPQNVILLSNGKVKVTGFCKKRFRKFIKSDTNPLMDIAISSVYYISPEQAHDEFIDKRTDIYSMGVVLYEMLIGALPKQNYYVSINNTILANIQSNVKSLTKNNSNIPLGLEQICVHAIQSNPLERYKNAEKMLHDIEAVIKNPQIIFNYSISLREYLLRLSDGRLDYKTTLDLFLPFMDSLIENNQKRNIDICPDNIYYVYDKNKLIFDKDISQGINLGYSSLETEKRGRRNETAIVYSIAACIFRTLVGKNPPVAVERERNDALMMPNAIADEIPTNIIRALGGALQVNSKNRTKTIFEFRQSLSFGENNTKNTYDNLLESFINNSDKVYKENNRKSVSLTGFKRNKSFQIFKKFHAKNDIKNQENNMANNKKMIQPYLGKKSYIFISYAHKDKKEVYPIIDKLLNDGFRIWYDDGIDPGTEWDENIAKHIEECGYFIPFISENYLNSSNCKDELNFARDLDKDRFLVYLENVDLPSGMNMRLSRLQNIHKYAYDSFNEFYNKLLTAKGINSFK